MYYGLESDPQAYGASPLQTDPSPQPLRCHPFEGYKELGDVGRINGKESGFFKKYIFYFMLYMSLVFCPYVYLYEGYREVQAAVWVLGIEPGYFGRVASALNC